MAVMLCCFGEGEWYERKCWQKHQKQPEQPRCDLPQRAALPAAGKSLPVSLASWLYAGSPGTHNGVLQRPVRRAVGLHPAGRQEAPAKALNGGAGQRAWSQAGAAVACVGPS